MYSRQINLPFKKNSLFLLGPRQTGKTTLVKELLANIDHIEIDLLKSDLFLKYKKRPELLRDEIEFAMREKRQLTVFIDEIQKVPELLNEIHNLIEQYKGKLFFILTGSSARKLRKASVNMLAGRAWEYFIYPLTYAEIGKDFVLDNVLLKGSLPPIMDQDIEDSFRTLNSYSQTYLKEEILDEAIVRNIGSFSRFLEIAADQSGKIVNCSTIARDVGVSSNTVKGYYQILEDTLVCVKVEPYLKSVRKRIITHPKYYLFDIGVVNCLNGRTTLQSIKVPSVYGVLFEHFVVLETKRMISYSERLFKISHWRTSHGAEVDLIIESDGLLWAVEIKSSKVVQSKDLIGLKSFMEDYPHAKPICVSICDRPYMAGEIPVIPWESLFHQKFLNLL